MVGRGGGNASRGGVVAALPLRHGRGREGAWCAGGLMEVKHLVSYLVQVTRCRRFVCQGCCRVGRYLVVSGSRVHTDLLHGIWRTAFHVFYICAIASVRTCVRWPMVLPHRVRSLIADTQRSLASCSFAKITPPPVLPRYTACVLLFGTCLRFVEHLPRIRCCTDDRP